MCSPSLRSIQQAKELSSRNPGDKGVGDDGVRALRLGGNASNPAPPHLLTDGQKVGAIPEHRCVVQGIAVDPYQVWPGAASTHPREGKPTAPRDPSHAPHRPMGFVIGHIGSLKETKGAKGNRIQAWAAGLERSPSLTTGGVLRPPWGKMGRVAIGSGKPGRLVIGTQARQVPLRTGC